MLLFISVSKQTLLHNFKSNSFKKQSILMTFQDRESCVNVVCSSPGHYCSHATKIKFCLTSPPPTLLSHTVLLTYYRRCAAMKP